MWWSKDDSAPAQQGDTGVESQAVTEMKEQFEQQQVLVHQLKDLVRQNEEQLKSKEHELQDSASKLSKLKLQHKARLSQLQNQLQESQKSNPVVPAKGEDGNSVGTPGTPTADPSRGKVLMLQKKLEENRTRFQKREKEIEDNNRSVEQMLQIMQTQLDERDGIIEELRTRNENGAEPPAEELPVSEPGTPSKDNNTVQKMYAQIVYKDSRMLELDSRIMELERNVMDLQETISEKDEVIRARNAAIQLMTDDLSRRGKVVVDQLDDTRDQMRLMQQNFAVLEDGWRDEKEALVRELNATAEKDLRLSEMKESCAKLETVRFELSTRNAELQEKVVRLQEILEKSKGKASRTDEPDIKGLKEENERLTTLISTHESTILALKKSGEEATKAGEQKLIKLKAQHKTVVKKMEKQIQDFKKSGARNDDLAILQHTNDELEKIKERQKSEIDDWRAKCDRQSLDLENHMRMISILEKNKLDVLEQLTLSDEKVATMQRAHEELRRVLDDAPENRKLDNVDVGQLRLNHEATVTELNDSSIRISDMTAEADRNRQTITDLRRELDTTALTVAELESCVARLMEEGTLARTALEASAAEVASQQENSARLADELELRRNEFEEILRARDAETRDARDSIERLKCDVEQRSRELLQMNELMENASVKAGSETDARLAVLTEQLVATQELLETERRADAEQRRTMDETLRERDDRLAELLEERRLKLQEVEDLCEALNDAQAKSSALQEELDELSINNRAQETRIQEYVDSLSAGDADLTAAVERVTSLSAELRSAQVQAEESQTSVRAAEQKMNELCIQLAEKATELERAADQLAAKDVEMATVTDQLDVKEKELATTSDELATRKVELATTFDQLSSTTVELTAATDQLLAIGYKMSEMSVEAETSAARLATLESELAEQQTEHTVTLTECNTHINRIASLESDLVSQQEANRELDDEATRLRTALDASETARLELTTQLEMDRARLSNSEAEVQRQAAILAKIAESGDRERLVAGELEQRVSELVLERDEAVRHSEELAVELSGKLEECLRSVNEELDTSRAAHDRLIVDFEEISEQLRGAQESNHSLEAEIGSLASVREVLEAKIKILEDGGRALDDEIQSLVSRNKSLEDDNKLLEVTRATLDAKITEVEDESCTLKGALELLENKYNALETEKEMLALEKHEQEDTRELLQTKYSSFEAEHNLLKVSIESLEIKCSELDKEKEMLEIQKQELEHTIVLLEDKFILIETEKESLKVAVESLEAKYDMLEKEKGSLDIENKELCTKNKDLEESSALLRAENESVVKDLRDKNDSLLSQYRSLVEEKGSAEDTKDSLQSKIETMVEDNRLLEIENVSLVTKIDLLGQEKGSLEGEKELLETRYNVLEEEKGSIEVVRQNLEMKNSVLEAERNSLLVERESYQSEMGDLRERIQELETLTVTLDNLNAEFSNLQDQLCAANQEKHELEAVNQLLKTEMESLETYKQEREARIWELEGSLADLDEIRSQMEIVVGEKQDLTTKAAQDIEERDLEREQSKCALELLVTQLNTVQLQVEAVENEKQALAEKISHLEDDRQVTSDHLEQLTATKVSLQTELKRATLEESDLVNSLRLEANDANVRQTQTFSEKIELESEIGRLRDGMARLQLYETEFQNSAQAVVDLEKQIASLVDELRTSKEQNERTMQYTQQLESDLEVTSEALQTAERDRDTFNSKLGDLELSLGDIAAARDAALAGEHQSSSRVQDLESNFREKVELVSKLETALAESQEQSNASLETLKEERDDLQLRLQEYESQLELTSCSLQEIQLQNNLIVEENRTLTLQIEDWARQVESVTERTKQEGSETEQRLVRSEALIRDFQVKCEELMIRIDEQEAKEVDIARQLKESEEGKTLVLEQQLALLNKLIEATDRSSKEKVVEELLLQEVHFHQEAIANKSHQLEELLTLNGHQGEDQQVTTADTDDTKWCNEENAWNEEQWNEDLVEENTECISDKSKSEILDVGGKSREEEKDRLTKELRGHQEALDAKSHELENVRLYLGEQSQVKQPLQQCMAEELVSLLESRIVDAERHRVEDVKTVELKLTQVKKDTDQLQLELTTLRAEKVSQKNEGFHSQEEVMGHIMNELSRATETIQAGFNKHLVTFQSRVSDGESLISVLKTRLTRDNVERKELGGKCETLVQALDEPCDLANESKVNCNIALSEKDKMNTAIISQLETQVSQLQLSNTNHSEGVMDTVVANGDMGVEKGSLENSESEIPSMKLQHEFESGKQNLFDGEHGGFQQDLSWKQMVADRDHQVAALHAEIARLGGDSGKMIELGIANKMELLRRELEEQCAAVVALEGERSDLVTRLESQHLELEAASARVTELTDERAGLAARLLEFEGMLDQLRTSHQENFKWAEQARELQEVITTELTPDIEAVSNWTDNSELRSVNDLVERVRHLVTERNSYREQLRDVRNQISSLTSENAQLEQAVKRLDALATETSRSSNGKCPSQPMDGETLERIVVVPTEVVVEKLTTQDNLVAATAGSPDKVDSVSVSPPPPPLSPEHQQLKSQLAISKMKSEKMLAKLKQFKDKNDKLQLQIGDMMQHRDNVEDDNAKLRDANERAHGEVRRLSTELRHSDRFWKSEVKMLNDRLDTVEVANAKLVEIKDELELRLDAQADKIRQLSANTTTDSLKSELDGTKSDLEVTKSELQLARSELDATKSQLHSVSSQFEVTSLQLEDVTREFENIKSELEATKSDLNTLMAEFDGTKSELELAKMQVNVAQCDLAPVRSKLEAIQEELESTKSDLDVQLNRCRNLTDANVTLELRAAAAESGNRESTDQLSLTLRQLEGQLASATEHTQFLESDNREYQELIARLEEDRQHREAEVREQSERVVALQSELGRLREAATMAENSKRNSTGEETDLVAELRRSCEDARKRCKDLENECLVLESEVAELREELETALDERVRCERERDNLRAELAEQTAAIPSVVVAEKVIQERGTIDIRDDLRTTEAVLVGSANDSSCNVGDWNESDAKLPITPVDCPHCPDLRQSIAALTDRNTDLASRLSAAESSVWSLEDEKQQIVEDARHREASVQRQWRCDSDVLVSANAELTTRATRLTDELESLRLRHEQLELEYRLTFQRQRETATGLEGLLNERRETDDARGAEVEQLRQQLGDTMDALTKRTALLETHAERAARLGSQLSVAEGEARAAEVERRALTDEVGRLRGENAALEQQMSNWKQHLGGFRRRNSDVDEGESRWSDIEDGGFGVGERRPSSPDDSEVVRLQAELSETMQGLHRRDLRCEELTSEISRMVEERDSLQIRLSRVMRADQHKDIEIHLLRQDRIRREQGENSDERLLQIGNDEHLSTSQTDLSDIGKRLGKSEGQRHELQRLNAVLDDALATEREHSSRLMAELKLANEELIVRTKGPKRMESMNISINEDTPLVPEYSQTVVRSYTGAPWRIANWLQGRSLKRVLHV